MTQIADQFIGAFYDACMHFSKVGKQHSERHFANGPTENILLETITDKKGIASLDSFRSLHHKHNEGAKAFAQAGDGDLFNADSCINEKRQILSSLEKGGNLGTAIQTAARYLANTTYFAQAQNAIIQKMQTAHEAAKKFIASIEPAGLREARAA